VRVARERHRRSGCRFDASGARLDLHGGQADRPAAVGYGSLAAELTRTAPRDCARTGRSRPLRVGPRFDLHGGQGGHNSPGCDSPMAATAAPDCDSPMAARSPSSPLDLRSFATLSGSILRSSRSPRTWILHRIGSSGLVVVDRNRLLGPRCGSRQLFKLPQVLFGDCIFGLNSITRIAILGTTSWSSALFVCLKMQP
jgi:hypothetical protein